MTLQTDGNESIECEFARYHIGNGILHGKFAPNAHIDLAAAQKCISMRNQLLRGRVMPILLDIRGLAHLTKEARDYLASDEVLSASTAGVLLTDRSVFTRTMANVYFRLTRPRIPHRAFASLETALKWLEPFSRVAIESIHRTQDARVLPFRNPRTGNMLAVPSLAKPGRRR